MSDHFPSMFWLPGKLPVETGDAAVASALAQLGRPVILVDDDGAAAVAKDGCLFMGDDGFPCGSDLPAGASWHSAPR